VYGNQGKTGQPRWRRLAWGALTPTHVTLRRRAARRRSRCAARDAQGSRMDQHRCGGRARIDRAVAA